jgi:hypothetical protein
MVDVGNHATSGYDENVKRDWENFLPYKHHFEALLGTSPLFDAEWITAAQVIWQHYRWFQNYYDRTFSTDAAGYFLRHAVRLKPAFPIHYITIYAQREHSKPRLESRFCIMRNIAISTKGGTMRLWSITSDFLSVKKSFCPTIFLKFALNTPHRICCKPLLSRL